MGFGAAAQHGRRLLCQILTPESLRARRGILMRIVVITR